MPRLRKEYHWGRLMTCYAKRPATVNDMLERSFAQSADSLAVVDGELRLTYRELGARAAVLATNLAARGVKKGDRVAVMLGNQLEALLAVIAIVRLGAVIVPIGTRLKYREISFIFADAQPVAVIHGAEFAAELPPEDEIALLRFECGGTRWKALLEDRGVAPVPVARVGEEDLYGILYTSGTTGRPKGAMLTHLNVIHSSLHWEDAHAMQRGERTILAIPWGHVAGLCGVVMPFLAIGGTMVLMAEFKRREFLQLAQKERITHALLVPAMYGLCLLEKDLDGFDLSTWRLGLYGSAPMPEPTIRRFAQAFPNLQFFNDTAATETTSPATMMPPGDGVLHAGSIGKTVPCGDILVMDDEGHEVPRGAEGEFWIGGPMVVPGYWRNPGADSASFAGGYWKSGDIGAIDTDGYVRIADRKKDMINRGGFKIYPAEVESVLAGIDGVVEAAVVGQPDAIMGESVIAFLNVTTTGLTEKEVQDHCAEVMADYKVPGRVVVGSAPLPRNANGKIQKAELRDMAKGLPPPERTRKAGT